MERKYGGMNLIKEMRDNINAQVGEYIVGAYLQILKGNDDGNMLSY